MLDLGSEIPSRKTKPFPVLPHRINTGAGGREVQAEYLGIAWTCYNHIPVSMGKKR